MVFELLERWVQAARVGWEDDVSAVHSGRIVPRTWCLDVSVETGVRVDPSGHVVVVGDIDVASAPSIEVALQQVEQQLAPGTDDAPGSVVIDVGNVGFIDSSGLRALLSASRRNEQVHRRVVLRTPGTALKRLLDITGTAMMFDLD